MAVTLSNSHYSHAPYRINTHTYFYMIQIWYNSSMHGNERGMVPILRSGPTPSHTSSLAIHSGCLRRARTYPVSSSQLQTGLANYRICKAIEQILHLSSCIRL